MIQVIVTLKDNDQQTSFEWKPNRDDKDTAKFVRVGSPNDIFLTSSQGLYYDKKKATVLLTGKPAQKTTKKASK